MAETPGAPVSFGLLLLRLVMGGLMLVNHGWGKLVNFGERSATFSDPLGIGSSASLALAVFAEVFCSVALILGFLTRATAIPLVITMWVAAFLHHAADPWSKKELAVVYSAAFLVLVFTGGGALSLDQILDPVYRKILRK